MIQMFRGLYSLPTNSSSEFAPSAPSPARPLTTAGFLSYATQWWPSRISRLTRFAPIRPSPIMPSCIGLSVAMVI